MNSKKIIALAVAIAISLIAYFAYKKFLPAGFSGFKASSSNNNSSGADKTEEEIFQENVDLVFTTLSEADKQDAYHIAKRAYDDCKGWNSHDMSIYRYINAFSNKKFYFFVTKAYPSYDSRSLTERLKMQNWGVLNSWSKKNGYKKKESAEREINKLIYRIENFKF